MKRFVLVVVLLFFVAIPIGILALLYHLPLDLADPSPAQPVPFSHKLHAGTNEIDCLFCHRGARISAVAGIPPMSICKACHLYIAADRPAIQQFMQKLDSNQPVEWIRVHNLPDHVYFAHKMHLNRDIECEACHGDVKNMEIIERQFSPKMGWCLGCHRKNGASIDCWTCHI